MFVEAYGEYLKIVEKTWRKPGENLEKPGDTGEDMELDKK